MPGVAVRIGVLSDTHLHRIGKEFKLMCDRYLLDADVIFHAGDYTSSEVISFLSQKPFHGVQGNMDSMEVKVALPEKKVIEIGGYKIGLIHGWGSSHALEERIAKEFQGVDAVVYGHSHKPETHVRDGILFLNPGTASGFSPSGIHTIGILECGATIQGEIVSLD